MKKAVLDGGRPGGGLGVVAEVGEEAHPADEVEGFAVW